MRMPVEIVKLVFKVALYLKYEPGITLITLNNSRSNFKLRTWEKVYYKRYKLMSISKYLTQEPSGN